MQHDFTFFFTDFKNFSIPDKLCTLTHVISMEFLGLNCRCLFHETSLYQEARRDSCVHRLSNNSLIIKLMITSSCTTSSYICSTQCNETKYSQHSPSELFQAPLNSTCSMACLLIFLLGTSFFSCSFFVLCFFSTILTSYRGLTSYNNNNTRKKINKIAGVNQSLRFLKYILLP